LRSGIYLYLYTGGWIARTRAELGNIMTDGTSDADLVDGARVYRRALKESLERIPPQFRALLT
jgi:hypothetical protein